MGQQTRDRERGSGGGRRKGRRETKRNCRKCRRGRVVGKREPESEGRKNKIICDDVGEMVVGKGERRAKRRARRERQGSERRVGVLGKLFYLSVNTWR